ncbi:MAG: hypothetical protein Q4C41_00705 [Eggerthellaceae bacterium]|nr:hypothetical protein [Eggerthellaceae bacterium]
MPNRSHNKLDATTFCKLYDDFGEEAARETLADVNEGRVSAETLEKYLYADESKEEYSARLKDEYSDIR